MVEKSISSLIIDKFGLNLYQKSLKFLTNKINLIDIKEDPIKIRSLILDNDREFHLIIDEENNEIFHDCPLFLIHSEREKKVCVHLIKILLVIKSNIAQNILENFKSYNLTSEDIGSYKKSSIFAREFNLPMVTISKKRDFKTGKTSIVGVDGKISGKRSCHTGNIKGTDGII